MGETGDALQDLVRGSGPNEGLGILVVHVDVLADGRFQFFHTPKDAPSNALVGDLGKPALHQVDPRGVSGSEMEMKSRALREPVPDKRSLMGAVVVHDDVRLQSGGHVGLDHIQELAKLRGAMPTMQLTDDAAGFQVQSRKQ